MFLVSLLTFIVTPEHKASFNYCSYKQITRLQEPHTTAAVQPTCASEQSTQVNGEHAITCWLHIIHLLKCDINIIKELFYILYKAIFSLGVCVNNWKWKHHVTLINLGLFHSRAAFLSLNGPEVIKLCESSKSDNVDLSSAWNEP